MRPAINPPEGLEIFVDEVVETSKQIEKIVTEPPAKVLIHTYRLEKDESNEWEANWEGAYGIWAFYMLAKEVIKENPEHQFIVYFAVDQQQGYEGTSMSSVYANTLKKLNLPFVKEIIDENDQKSSGSVGTKDEVDFLAKNIQNNEPVLQIGRAGHTNRISALAKNRGLNSTVIASEGILYNYMPEAFTEHLDQKQVQNELKSYNRDERIFLMLTLIDGGKGDVLALISKLAGSKLRNRVVESVKRIRGIR